MVRVKDVGAGPTSLPKPPNVAATQCSRALSFRPGPEAGYRNDVESLLQPGESRLPSPVQEVIRHMDRNGVGFLLSRNPVVTSCRDARSKRRRLGQRGIPLCDELKSLVGIVRDGTGGKAYVAMHCRAHQDFDEQLARHALGGRFEAMSSELLVDTFGMAYGTVNPFQLAAQNEVDVTQVFDVGLFETPVSIPGTMMTNAGVHTWAIEFNPDDLVTAVPSAQVTRIAVPSGRSLDPLETAEPLPIGIVTGNNAESGIALWSLINEEVARLLGQHFRGDISRPPVYIESLPGLGLSMELARREDAVWQVLRSAVQSLCGRGIKILAMPAHTTHYFADGVEAICREHGVQFVSMVDVVEQELIVRQARHVAFLGVGSVPDLTSHWSPYHRLSNGMADVEALDPRTVAAIERIAYHVKQKGPERGAFQSLTSLIRKHIGAPTVVLALTELSLLMQKFSSKGHRSERDVVDVLHEYARAVARACLGLDVPAVQMSIPAAGSVSIQQEGEEVQR